MSDYSDWEGWFEDALFDALVVARREDIALSKSARAHMEEALKRVQDAWEALKSSYEPDLE